MLYGWPLLPSRRSDLTEVRFSQAPEGGEFTFVTWLPALNKLVVSLLPRERQGWSSQFYTVSRDQAEFAPLSLPPDPDCQHSARYVPSALPIGRLGYIEKCFLPKTRRRIPQEAVTLMAYEPATGSAERLRPYYLPFAASVFAFGRPLDKGVLNDGNGLQDRLHWLYPDRLAPLDLPFVGISAPGWSPDGQTIAFGPDLNHILRM